MLSEGMMLANRYEVIDKVGTGGMSDVYKAKDHILGRNVAIKVLKQEFGEDINFVTKFRTEAQAAAGLEHPNIVNIYDVGSENRMHYIVMEYIEGITLKTYIEKRGKIQFNEAVSIAIQVSNGIRAAASSNTVNSDVMGSVHYTSPEQARNGFVDYKSDIYSLGIVMYEMVTGKVPFSGDNAVSIAIQHLQEEIVSPSTYAQDLPISLEKIILKCTQKSPDRRYDTVDELIADLKNALINPDEDFVTIAPGPMQDKTRVISAADVNKIKSETSGNYYKAMDEDLDGEDDEEDDEEDDDGVLSPKMEKAVTIMTIAVVIVIVGIIVAIVGNVLGWFKFGGSTDTDKDKDKTDTVKETKKVEMIDLKGMDVEKARKELSDLGLGIRVKEMKEDDNFKENQVISQSVEEGDMVDKNTTIDVVVCSGEKGVEIDDVSGKKEAEAKSILEAKKFKTTVEYQYSDTIETGNVISTNPVAGSLGKKDDMVKIFVSRGKEDVAVPSVVGQTKETAESKLKAAGFNVSSTTQNSDTIEAGKVISQSIDGGKKAAPGTTIALVISAGKKDVYYNLDVTLDPPSADIKKVKVTVLINGVAFPGWDSNAERPLPARVEISGQIKNTSTATLKLVWIKEDGTDGGSETKSVTLTQAN